MARHPLMPGPLAFLVLAAGCAPPAGPTPPPRSMPPPSTPADTSSPAEPPTPARWTFEEGALPEGFVREGTLPEGLVQCELPASDRERFLTGPLAVRLGKLAQLGGTYWMHPYDMGQEGRCRLDTAGRHGGDGGVANGAVLSPLVPRAPRYVSFLAGGGGGPRTWIELCEQKATACDPIPGLRTEGPGSLAMRRVHWDLGGSPALGKPIRLRIVDHAGPDGARAAAQPPARPPTAPAEASTASERGRRFLVIDDIRFEDGPPPAPREPPAWGFADLHAHFFNHLAFGGKLLHGGVTGSMKEALVNCKVNHWDVITPEGDGITFDNKVGYPTFKDWPRFDSKAHQQAYIDWIHRAYLGGLRLAQVDVGNSRTFREAYELFHKDPGLSPSDDRSVIEAQVRAARAFVSGPAREWAAIAATPAEARAIVRAGKLALVLGVEMDRPFESFRRTLPPGTTDAAAVRDYVLWLKSLGVRHYFPVHVMENVFSSPAVYSRLFYVAGKHEAGRWLPLAQGADEGIRYDVFKDKEQAMARLLLQYLPGMLKRGSDGRSAAADTELQALLGTGVRSPKAGPHRAAGGLTPIGEVLIGELMRAGMLIDLTHMSQAGRKRTLDLAEARAYPLLSSHTGFRDIQFGHAEKAVHRPNGDYEVTLLDAPYSAERYGTSKITKVASEAALTRDEVRRIRDGGGVVGLGIGAESDRVVWLDRVRPDCDGTSKSFAQRYLYALDALRRDGRVNGLAIGTDVNGFAGLPPPRFGVDACHDGMADKERIAKQAPRDQKTPVLYDVAPRTEPVRKALDRYGVPLVAPVPAPEVIVRYRTAPGADGRDYDVNIEGVAHYGLLPDFLQDLVNVGVRPEELGPLFHGVEDYLRMWEIAEARAAEIARTTP